MMTSLIKISMIAVFSGLCFSLVAQQDIRIMIVTGGHDFDRPEFFGMFDRIDGIRYQEVKQPMANHLIETGGTEDYDLLIFYDMYDSITDRQQRAYLELVDGKKPMIFLHHSLVSYQDWPEFAHMIGGRYHTRDQARLSNYRHDVDIEVHIADSTHPITKGLTDFTLFDEVYGQCEILPQVHPLLTTTHPESMPILAWVNRYRGHDIAFLQSGHGPGAFRNGDFQQILRQAIFWCASEQRPR